jgi:hypothetical protein
MSIRKPKSTFISEISPEEGAGPKTISGPRSRTALLMTAVLSLANLTGCPALSNNGDNGSPDRCGESLRIGFEEQINQQKLVVTTHPHVETGIGLKVRDGLVPEKSHILDRLHPGEEVFVKQAVPICDQKGFITWMGQVEMPDGTTGWVTISFENDYTERRQYYLVLPSAVDNQG